MDILVLTIGSHGDIHPFVGVAAKLRERGHKVKFVASSYFAPLIEKTGLDFIPIGTPDDFESVARNPKIWHWFHGGRAIGQSIGASIRPFYKAILENSVPGKTVLVHSTLVFAARVAQETLKLRAATIHLAPSIFLSADAPPGNMPLWLPRPARKLIYGALENMLMQPIFGRPINKFRRELGLRPVRRIITHWCHSPNRVIGLFPDWFGPPQKDWPPQVKLTGFPLYDEKDVTPLPPELETFLQSGTPPIAFTPGSAMFFGQKFFAAAAEACQRMGRRGVLLTRHAEQIPANLPAGVIHIPFAPFGLLLPRCAAVVHHGGIGSIAQGLSSGVPQLIMPMNFDQPDNAYRVKRLGVGDYLFPKQFTGGNAAAALDRLIQSPSVAQSCRQIAQRIAATDALTQTAECIEQLAP